MGIPTGYNQITSLGTARTLGYGLTSNLIPAGSQWAVIVAETQDVRWRDDGVDPTASVGMLLVKNVPMVYDGKMSAIKFIETTSSAKLNITFYKTGDFSVMAGESVEGVTALAQTPKKGRGRKEEK